MYIDVCIYTHMHIYTDLTRKRKCVCGNVFFGVIFKDLKVINNLSNIFLSISNCTLRRSLKRIFQKTNNTNLKFLFKCPQNVSSKLSKSFLNFLVFLHLFSLMMNDLALQTTSKQIPNKNKFKNKFSQKIKNKIYHKTNSLNSNYKNTTSSSAIITKWSFQKSIQNQKQIW